jgi:hypothetical protein
MGFKQRKLSLVLQVKATKPQSSTLPKSGSASTSKPRGSPKKPQTGGAPAHDYDPLYVDSSDEEEQMKDIQPSPSLSRSAGATAVSPTSSGSVLTRCFNELLKARNEVSWTSECAFTLPQSPSDRHHEQVRKPG